MYAMDHTTHFEHRIESRPARSRFLRRADTAWSNRTVNMSNGDTSDREREQPEATSWPFPEFAD